MEERPWPSVTSKSGVIVNCLPLYLPQPTGLSCSLCPPPLHCDMESDVKYSLLEPWDFLILHLLSSFQAQGLSLCTQVPWTWDFPPFSVGSLAMRYILFDSWGHGSHFSNLLLSTHYMFPGHLLFALHDSGLSTQFAWAPLDPSQVKTTLTLLTPPTNWCFPELYFIVWTHGSMFLPLTEFSYSDSSFRPINVGERKLFKDDEETTY